MLRMSEILPIAKRASIGVVAACSLAGAAGAAPIFSTSGLWESDGAGMAVATATSPWFDGGLYDLKWSSTALYASAEWRLFDWAHATLETSQGDVLADLGDTFHEDIHSPELFGPGYGDWGRPELGAGDQYTLFATDPIYVWRHEKTRGRFELRLFADESAIGKAWTVTLNAVPEPSTWAIMILGFGAVGAALRRRRAALTA